MARLVIDANITLAWLFDEDSASARIKPVLDRSELVAPWLWLLEVTNAVLVRERRRMLAEAQAFRLLQLLDELTIELMPEPLSRTASGLAQTARPHQLSAYDAVYLDLAIRMGLSLFTRDENLRAAAAHVGVPLARELAR